MSNMSYCRWENTASDLDDCLESWHEGVASKDEAYARRRLVKVAQEILSLYECDKEMVDNLELNEEGRGYEDEDEEDGEGEDESEG